MTLYPSVLTPGLDPSLAAQYPTLLPNPERLVYQHIADACGYQGMTDPQDRFEQPTTPQDGITFDEDGSGITLPATFATPPLSFYADRPGPAIPVVRGYPTWPGEVPMIGVAVGPDTTQDEREAIGADYAGQVITLDDEGNPLSGADYYSNPLFCTIAVQFIHTNRDERDRLHDGLRRVMFPLKRLLPNYDGLITGVRVDGEKQDLPLDEQPLIIYVSLYTVAVQYEMLEAVDVVDDGGFIAAIQSWVIPGIPGQPPANPFLATADVTPVPVSDPDQTPVQFPYLD